MGTVRKRTTYSYEEDGNYFPLIFQPYDEVKVHIDGDKAILGYLVQDEAAEDWYFDERDEGEFYGFDRRVKGYKPLDHDDIEGLVQKNPGRVFWINLYEHGLSRYYREGDALQSLTAPGTAPADPRLIIPDQQWDVSRGVAIYVAPEDCPDPAKYTDSCMQEFSDWCNGSIYGAVIEEFERDGDEWVQTESDNVWGHIGYEWANEALDEEFDSTVKSLSSQH